MRQEDKKKRGKKQAGSAPPPPRLHAGNTPTVAAVPEWPARRRAHAHTRACAPHHKAGGVSREKPLPLLSPPPPPPTRDAVAGAGGTPAAAVYGTVGLDKSAHTKKRTRRAAALHPITPAPPSSLALCWWRVPEELPHSPPPPTYSPAPSQRIRWPGGGQVGWPRGTPPLSLWRGWGREGGGAHATPPTATTASHLAQDAHPTVPAASHWRRMCPPTGTRHARARARAHRTYFAEPSGAGPAGTTPARAPPLPTPVPVGSSTRPPLCRVGCACQSVCPRVPTQGQRSRFWLPPWTACAAAWCGVGAPLVGRRRECAVGRRVHGGWAASLRNDLQ